MAVGKRYWCPGVVPLVCHEEPGFVQALDRTPKRAANVVEVEVWIRKGIERTLRSEDADLVLHLQGRERRDLVVVKGGAVKLVLATYGGDTNIGDPAVLSTEIIRKNVHFTDRLERRLARHMRAKDRIRGALSVNGEIRAITLESE